MHYRISENPWSVTFEDWDFEIWEKIFKDHTSCKRIKYDFNKYYHAEANLNREMDLIEINGHKLPCRKTISANVIFYDEEMYLMFMSKYKHLFKDYPFVY